MTAPPLRSSNFSRYFLLILVLLVAGLFFYMIRGFMQPVLLAAVFATVLYPLFERLLRLFGGRRALAAIATCLLLLIGVVAPLVGIGDMVAREAVGFYENVQDDFKALLQGGQQGIQERIQAMPWFSRFGLGRLDWNRILEQASQSAGSAAGWLLNKTSSGTVQLIWTSFVTLFTLFYFLLDGPRLVQKIKDAVPLPREHENRLIQRFVAVTSATVKGTLVIAFIQGALGGLTLWICGIPSPILWTVVMIVMSIIPVLGVGLVMYPAAIFALATGQVWQGVTILIVTTVVIVNIDNLLRPRLVGAEAGMHDLLVFFSTIGGLSMFGFAGFVIGPVIGSFLLALLDLYEAEFRVREVSGADSPVALEVERPPVPKTKKPRPSRGGGDA